MVPYPAVVAGNEAVDAGCGEAEGLAPQTDVLIPTGGAFCYFTVDGRAITEAPRRAFRRLSREQAEELWSHHIGPGEPYHHLPSKL